MSKPIFGADGDVIGSVKLTDSELADRIRTAYYGGVAEDGVTMPQLSEACRQATRCKSCGEPPEVLHVALLDDLSTAIVWDCHGRRFAVRFERNEWDSGSDRLTKHQRVVSEAIVELTRKANGWGARPLPQVPSAI